MSPSVFNTITVFLASCDKEIIKPTGRTEDEGFPLELPAVVLFWSYNGGRGDALKEFCKDGGHSFFSRRVTTK